MHPRVVKVRPFLILEDVLKFHYREKTPEMVEYNKICDALSGESELPATRRPSPQFFISAALIYIYDLHHG